MQILGLESAINYAEKYPDSVKALLYLSYIHTWPFTPSYQPGKVHGYNSDIFERCSLGFVIVYNSTPEKLNDAYFRQCHEQMILRSISGSLAAHRFYEDYPGISSAHISRMPEGGYLSVWGAVAYFITVDHETIRKTQRLLLDSEQQDWTENIYAKLENVLKLYGIFIVSLEQAYSQKDQYCQKPVLFDHMPSYYCDQDVVTKALGGRDYVVEEITPQIRTEYESIYSYNSRPVIDLNNYILDQSRKVFDDVRCMISDSDKQCIEKSYIALTCELYTYFIRSDKLYGKYNQRCQDNLKARYQ